MMVALSFMLALSGFALLALSLARHYRDLFRKTLPLVRGRVFRAVGWLLIGASIIGPVIAQGVGIGLVLWFALLNVAALIVGLLITYWDKWWRV